MLIIHSNRLILSFWISIHFWGRLKLTTQLIGLICSKIKFTRRHWTHQENVGNDSSRVQPLHGWGLCDWCHSLCALLPGTALSNFTGLHEVFAGVLEAGPLCLATPPLIAAVGQWCARHGTTTTHPTWCVWAGILLFSVSTHLQEGHMW